MEKECKMSEPWEQTSKRKWIETKIKQTKSSAKQKCLGKRRGGACYSSDRVKTEVLNKEIEKKPNVYLGPYNLECYGVQRKKQPSLN